MNVTTTDLEGVLLLTPRRFADERGWFQETFNARAFQAATGLVADFVQDNESLSRERHTLRGLHFQSPPFAQGKLVRVVTGAVFDVAVDLRHGSPTFGRWTAATLTARGGEQLWVPEGFAHGFLTLEPDTRVAYKVTAFYARDHDLGLAWDDPELAIAWPQRPRALSDKDAAQPRLAALPPWFGVPGGTNGTA
ncbi:MAG: dTDP-4-dehydrorhamnose 3,5-epimerase [Geminicoccaceae bacterium]|nr:MAG: dTDP-4-dehydrorhamnose 3,5-epimerase [Geminicoccaceae bacterium]